MYLLLARIYEFRWQLTASPGFPAQVCNSQGGRRHCFITLGCLLPILCGFYFLYIGRDSFTHLRITRHSSIILINHIWLKNRVFSIFLSACKQGFCLRRSRGHFPSHSRARGPGLDYVRTWHYLMTRHDACLQTKITVSPGFLTVLSPCSYDIDMR